MTKMTSSTSKAIDHRSKILQVAMRLARTRGFNAFSYRDIQAEVGIKTASIHYHFPTKKDLGLALMTQYIQENEQLLADIAQSNQSYLAQFRAYTQLFGKDDDSVQELCLAGMLASDVDTLTTELETLIQKFFVQSEAWLTALFTAGQQSGEFKSTFEPSSIARLAVDALEGALSTARVFHKPQRPMQVAQALEALLI
ncbi:TetR/AcrR family transcriptional regulator [Hydromonas duriensis]|nr:TetR/AcrR family transcriptional regulator [Hydromonas duriensis]